MTDLVFHKGLHEFLKTQNTVFAFDTTHFVVLFYTVRCHSWIPDDERNSFLDMGANLYWGRVVGQYSDAYRFVPGYHLFIYWFHNTVVEILYGFNLEVEVAVVSRFVCSFEMQVNEVLFL